MRNTYTTRAFCDAPTPAVRARMRENVAGGLERSTVPLRVVAEEFHPRTEAELIRYPDCREPYMFVATAEEIV